MRITVDITDTNVLAAISAMHGPESTDEDYLKWRVAQLLQEAVATKARAEAEAELQAALQAAASAATVTITA